MWVTKKRLTLHDAIELHGLGDAMSVVLNVTEALTRLGYVSLEKIETLTTEVKTWQGLNAKRAKLVVRLKKTSQFDSLYEEYEKLNQFEDLLKQ
mmetsp:Transcript_28455/g.13162  ORF Transcript_28455/g.13162 Transcript_28455/m.13162 type:complete len:94 (-) Transcript_28455:32-313(-)